MARNIQRRNRLANSASKGGSSGVLPFDWSFASYDSNPGLTYTIVGTGIEDGIRYTDIQVSGTYAGGGTNNRQLVFSPVSQSFPLLYGDSHVISAYVKLAAGSLTNVTFDIGFNQWPINGARVAIPVTAFVPNNGRLRDQRVFCANVCNQPTAATLECKIDFNFVAGPIDVTLRVGWPQLEFGLVPSEPQDVFSKYSDLFTPWGPVNVSPPPPPGVAVDLDFVSANYTNGSLNDISNGSGAVRQALNQGIDVGGSATGAARFIYGHSISPANWSVHGFGGDEGMFTDTGPTGSPNWPNPRIFKTSNSGYCYNLLTEQPTVGETIIVQAAFRPAMNSSGGVLVNRGGRIKCVWNAGLGGFYGNAGASSEGFRLSNLTDQTAANWVQEGTATCTFIGATTPDAQGFITVSFKHVVQAADLFFMIQPEQISAGSQISVGGIQVIRQSSSIAAWTDVGTTTVSVAGDTLAVVPGSGLDGLFQGVAGCALLEVQQLDKGCVGYVGYQPSTPGTLLLCGSTATMQPASPTEFKTSAQTNPVPMGLGGWRGITRIGMSWDANGNWSMCANGGPVAKGAGGGGGSQTGIQAQLTTDFLDRVRVCARTGLTGGGYNINTNNIQTAMDYIGFKHIRDFYLETTDTIISQNVGWGYKYTLTNGNGSPAQSGSAFVASVSNLKRQYPNGIVAIEGPNEAQSSVTTSAQSVRDAWNAAQSDPVLNNGSIDILNFTIKGVASNYTAAAFPNDLGSFITFGTWHDDPIGNPAWPAAGSTNSWSGWSGGIKALTTVQKTMVCTACGAATFDEISTANQSKLWLNGIMSMARQGDPYVYLNELINSGSDTSNLGSFGAFLSNMTAKPVATAMRNFFQLLQVRSGNLGAGKLDYTVTGLNANGSHYLLQSGDGAFYILITEQNAYGTAPSNKTITINGGAHYNVNVYDPTVSQAVQQTVSNTASFTVPVADSMKIIELVNASPTASGLVHTGTIGLMRGITGKLRRISADSAALTDAQLQTWTSIHDKTFVAPGNSLVPSSGGRWATPGVQTFFDDFEADSFLHINNGRAFPYPGFAQMAAAYNTDPTNINHSKKWKPRYHFHTTNSHGSADQSTGSNHELQEFLDPDSGNGILTHQFAQTVNGRASYFKGTTGYCGTLNSTQQGFIDSQNLTKLPGFTSLWSGTKHDYYSWCMTTYSGSTTEATASGFTSDGGWQQRFGVYSARLKFPTNHLGAWAAYWLFNWANNCEWDIQEQNGPATWGGPQNYDMSVHWNNYANNASLPQSSGINTGMLLDLDFHDYTGLWKAGRVEMYLDGEWLGGGTTGGDFDTLPKFLLFNFAIFPNPSGNPWNVGSPAPDAASRGSMPWFTFIDWVRIFQFT